MKVLSRIDPDTYYVVTTNHVRMVRNGDKMTIPYCHIPEQAKRFKPEIQEELMAFWEAKHPLVVCEWCGKQFYEGVKKKYCSKECVTAAGKEKSKARQSQQLQTCVWCGEEFRGYSGRKYCGSDCKKESRQSKAKEDTRPTWAGNLQGKLQQAESQGMSYAEMQKRETLNMVGRVVI